MDLAITKWVDNYINNYFNMHCVYFHFWFLSPNIQNPPYPPFFFFFQYYSSVSAPFDSVCSSWLSLAVFHKKTTKKKNLASTSNSWHFLYFGWKRRTSMWRCLLVLFGWMLVVWTSQFTHPGVPHSPEFLLWADFIDSCQNVRRNLPNITESVLILP